MYIYIYVYLPNVSTKAITIRADMFAFYWNDAQHNWIATRSC